MKETQNCFGIEGLKKVIEWKSISLMAGKTTIFFYRDAVIVTNDEDEATVAGKESEHIAIVNLDEQRLKFI